MKQPGLFLLPLVLIACTPWPDTTDDPEAFRSDALDGDDDEIEEEDEELIDEIGPPRCERPAKDDERGDARSARTASEALGRVQHTGGRRSGSLAREQGHRARVPREARLEGSRRDVPLVTRRGRTGLRRRGQEAQRRRSDGALRR